MIVRPPSPARCATVAASACTPSTEGVRDFLAEQRRGSTAALRERLETGRAAGDVPPDTDLDALAAYVSTVQFGMSLQARDGATADELTAVVDHAMIACERRLRPAA